jgi:hypothetical protein
MGFSKIKKVAGVTLTAAGLFVGATTANATENEIPQEVIVHQYEDIQATCIPGAPANQLTVIRNTTMWSASSGGTNQGTLLSGRVVQRDAGNATVGTRTRVFVPGAAGFTFWVNSADLRAILPC